ncbi:hypothetical protein [Catellatospora coxensis]|uniref:Secreted protein n=1 Tax=Catellatospora coxensis TaxID=310354 RepID=A0A8J3KZS4_9ACTN|nr:hypothetical protein [Catellatospora coxensis]GIG08534.1 hypothetical protein Cco03nite_52340 [Catellatospora coxensis]
MDTGQIIILLVVLAAVAAAAYVAWTVLRRQSLRRRFGPEYDRAVAEHDTRTDAERDLRDRERRHAELELRELTPQDHARFVVRWHALQSHFIDAPADAVGEADVLVRDLITARGYPADDDEEQLAQLSVDHAATLASYREAKEIADRNSRGEAGTEDLRVAVVRYRELVAQLLGEDPAPADPAPAAQRDTAAAATPRRDEEVHA